MACGSTAPHSRSRAQRHTTPVSRSCSSTEAGQSGSQSPEEIQRRLAVVALARALQSCAAPQPKRGGTASSRLLTGRRTGALQAERRRLAGLALGAQRKGLGRHAHRARAFPFEATRATPKSGHLLEASMRAFISRSRSQARAQRLPHHPLIWLSESQPP